MTRKQRFKFELYRIFLNADQGKLTDNEHQLFHHLAVDDEVSDALTKSARRDYRAMNLAAKKSKAMNPCNVRACGCLQGRPTKTDKGMCLCGHSHFQHTIRISLDK